jgi:hypothetical protein
MRIAFVSANLGGIDVDRQALHVKQDIDVDFFYYTDYNMPPRSDAMTPRLQAKIPKMLAFELVPDYDYYIWADACFTLSSEHAISWLIEQLGCSDIAVFRHQEHRSNIMSEYLFMQRHIAGVSGDAYAQEYLTSRYGNEPVLDQIRTYYSDVRFTDTTLFSAGMFVYQNAANVRRALMDWFYQCARYSVQDQISLPYILSMNLLNVSVIDEDITNNKYTTYTNRRHVNKGKWNKLYESLPSAPSAFLYGETQTYKIGADLLADCKTVEDWGTGAGGFKRYRQDAIGVDGSNTPYADVIADLTAYRSSVEGIFMRHVIEHNYEWRTILINALASVTKRLVIVLFTDLSDSNTEAVEGAEQENAAFGVFVPTLRLSREELKTVFIGRCAAFKITGVPSTTRYGTETIIVVDK